MTPTQRASLDLLLREYKDIFAITPAELGRTNVVKHHIDVGTHPPICLHPYRVPESQKQIITEHIDDMLDRDIIQLSTSPWAAPVVLVEKPNGSKRFCVDYRKLNAVTKKDSFPLPLIQESIDALSGTQIFSTIDVLSGYWQVEMDEQSRRKLLLPHMMG